LGKLSLLAGDPGLGKSFITLDMAARVSRGTPFPDCCNTPNPTGGVVLLSAEDDLADTIRPRLDAAGADVDRIHALTTIQSGFDAKTKQPIRAPFNLTEDRPMLERALRQVGG
jgi:RecA-family ATPase